VPAKPGEWNIGPPSKVQGLRSKVENGTPGPRGAAFDFGLWTLDLGLSSFVLRASSFVILLTALLAAGCFSPRPDFYVLRGRVLDAETGRGLGDARLRLRAAIATGLGPRVFSAYGMTAPDGSYELELSEGYDALRLAGRIRLDAGKSGYATCGAEIPPPARKQKVYVAPDVVLQRAELEPFAPPRAGEP